MTDEVLPLPTPADLQRRVESVAVEEVHWPLMAKHGLQLRVRRDDCVDAELSGNKLYKLFINLAAARQQGKETLVSFGGAYSNHLHALAAAGRRYGFTSIGIVRGERPAVLSPTLVDAERWGMRLYFVSRGRYRRATEHLQDELLEELRRECGDFYLIPEGGANLAGVQGVQAIGRALEAHLGGDYDQVCIACGTGTSLAGIAAGLPANKIALGFSVLKGAGDLGSTILASWHAVLVATGRADRLQQAANWRLISGYHAGGYGRKLPERVQLFWREFESQTGLLLDPVYTLKLFWGIAQLAQQGYWSRGTRLVAIHTGGLQGRRGLITDDASPGSAPVDKMKG